MPKNLFVILSDIHIKISNKEDILHKFEIFIKTLNAIRKLGDHHKIIILVSGDLAFSGKAEEYDYLEGVFE
ncbi:TPA: hypothetical protein H7W45_004632 [Escherichia coli]|nr:hypothetical protein [Escherichia coli]